jgi:hypothetical protein
VNEVYDSKVGDLVMVVYSAQTACILGLSRCCAVLCACSGAEVFCLQLRLQLALLALIGMFGG